MWSHYDENLCDNPFYKELVSNHGDIVRRCCDEGWIVCVPRQGSANAPANFDQILDHILIPDGQEFVTLSKKQLEVVNKKIKVRNCQQLNSAVEVLFEETFYVEKAGKYVVWCVDRPLFTEYVCKSHQPVSLGSVHDCIDFLWVESLTHQILDHIQGLAGGFWGQHCGFATESLQTQKDLLGKLYSQCLQAALKNHHLKEKASNPAFLDNLQIAVETYMHYCLGDRLMWAVNTGCCQLDCQFNRIVRNAGAVKLGDFGAAVVAVKCELGKLNGCRTVLDKLSCLQRTFKCLYECELPKNVTGDDWLKILVQAVVCLNIGNWWGNLYFIKHYRFSMKLVGACDYVVSTLEAALEFVRSTQFFDLSRQLDLGAQPQPFNYVRLGDLGAIQTLLNGNNAQEPIVEGILCHPLCTCERCVTLLHSSQDNNKSTFNLQMLNEQGQTLLIYASIFGQADLLDFFLSQNCDVNCKDYNNRTALHHAVSQGHQHLIFLLICYGADVNATDNDKNTPLYLACENGHENCVKALIYASPLLNVNQSNFFGDTPLHVACKWGFVDIIKILLENYAKPNLKNRRQQIPLDLCSNYHTRKLLENAPDVPDLKLLDQKLSSALEILELPQSQPQSKCDHGCKPRNLEQFKKIDLLLRAIENNDLPLTCFYLGFNNDSNVKIEADVNKKCHPLCNCPSCVDTDATATQQQPKTAHLSVNTCNAFGYTPLHIAAKYGRLEILRLLLDSAANLNVKTYTTLYTPLHLASMFQRTKIVHELLNCGGCKVDQSDSKGNTPLYYAATKGHKKITELLLANGANCNHKNGQNKTIVQEAEEKMLLAIVNLCRQNSEEENNKNREGWDIF